MQTITDFNRANVRHCHTGHITAMSRGHIALTEYCVEMKNVPYAEYLSCTPNIKYGLHSYGCGYGARIGRGSPRCVGTCVVYGP